MNAAELPVLDRRLSFGLPGDVGSVPGVGKVRAGCAPIGALTVAL